MDLIRDSVLKIRELLEHGGCGEGDVLLDVNPKAVNCQFEKGACMTASFGGRTADFVTFDPIRARTRISFMYDAPLDTPATRGAASAIINVVTGFFCLSRVLHACPESSHAACLAEFRPYIGNRRVYVVGEIPAFGDHFRGQIVPDPEHADIILIGGDGMVISGTGNLIERYREKKRIVGIGPSVAGICRIHQIEHWCPYGRSS
ncbi:MULTISPECIES: hypothetical protein [unclassified Methanoregula]|uniref:hypothetical protein n=1 Tax=unclassified Methanoregula TaxID=2649730 RepID=UPI0009CAE7E7|nr:MULTISPECIES: hypothetical protein [unclassified Methanoregula]OPX61700.1 MAG: hypothetical protein A4E33_02800 [Methanoregula sp. PtaB.Bin085]OPY33991.1 MAG: hypothetical protein A4E34_01578 [Methanoregula sp. PtaU1.Bin006]